MDIMRVSLTTAYAKEKKPLKGKSFDWCSPGIMPTRTYSYKVAVSRKNAIITGTAHVKRK